MLFCEIEPDVISVMVLPFRSSPVDVMPTPPIVAADAVMPSVVFQVLLVSSDSVEAFTVPVVMVLPETVV